MGTEPRQIWWIRHALPRVDPSEPADTWPLSDAGREATKQLAHHIAWGEVAFIGASHEVKAQQTAAILADVGHVSWRIVAGLEELRAPWFDSPADLSAAFGSYLAFRSGSGFESWTMAAARIRSAAERALAEAHPKVPVLVSHGRILTVFFNEMLAEPFTVGDWKALKFPDICRFDTDAGRLLPEPDLPGQRQ
jgi:broad specificity phosphatase PhoE